MVDGKRPGRDVLEKQAAEAERELREALVLAGVNLPSLRVDPWQGISSEVMVLVELGSVRPDTAVRLADVLRRGASVAA
jgi:hypothetical protein